MARLATAERVSRDASDNFVFQRSLLAYDRAAALVSGDVLEIGTGTGYGIERIAPRCRRFVTVDKFAAAPIPATAGVEFRRMCVPPLGFRRRIVRFRHHLSGDRAHRRRRSLRARNRPRAAPGWTTDPHHAQRPDVAHTQSVARARVPHRGAAEAARGGLSDHRGLRRLRQRTRGGLLRSEPPQRGAHRAVRHLRPPAPAARAGCCNSLTTCSTASTAAGCCGATRR